MSRNKRSLRAFSNRQVVPFDTASDAWFWFTRCQVLRHAGARFVADQGGIARPCDPDDIYRSVMALHREGKLDRHHLKVLEYYGIRECPPDPRDPLQSKDDQAWEFALNKLHDRLSLKGIVAEVVP